jgi:arylsulfatase A-like enzyme
MTALFCCRCRSELLLEGEKMIKRLSRRDFLKLAGVLPLSVAAPRLWEIASRNQSFQPRQQNVIVVVYDAFSACHLSFLGYERETTPQLAKLLERAVVYHRHYAGGNFTTPGTASLLTGTLPWTHRALNPNGTVIEPFVTRNIFSAFQGYYRLAYTHNIWANKLLEQFQGEMEELVPWEQLFLQSYDGFLHNLFPKDFDIASVSWIRNMKMEDEGYAYSLFLSHVYEALQEQKVTNFESIFPRGIPSTGRADINFVLENATDWIALRLAQSQQPFLGYFHFLPPHAPYRTRLEFYNRFRRDGFLPVRKPEDVFTQKVTEDDLIQKRMEYDEFLLYVDREFARFFSYLEESGLLENTWIVFTSDHGEMFERGIDGHSMDALYEPVIRIPLMIFEPGRKKGMNIHTPTSAIDVLPTMLHWTGREIPDWIEGEILPPYRAIEINPERSMYVVRANRNHPYEPINQRASLVNIHGRYKLHYYFGYEERNIDELIKLFDLEADPEELVDLYPSKRSVADGMLQELKSRLEEANRPYL